jgi:predicted alpha/beta-fold hydrolase
LISWIRLDPVELFKNKIKSHKIMELKAPVGLYITTYELSNAKRTPTLSHVFWGQDLAQAVHNAKSHLIDDTFFSGSFVGHMPWKNFVLHLGNTGQILSQRSVQHPHDLDAAMDELEREAERIYAAQEDQGMIQIVQILSQEFT